MKPLKIVFMGTPEFATHTMEKIIQSHHQIVGVVSQPDRPKGRGKKLQPTPVKAFALSHQLSPILQPERLKDPEFLENLASLNADIFVVVAFRILPEVVFDMPKIATINLHPSLLPKYRGAAPLNWAILNGDSETGISTIFLKKRIDAGNILFQETYPINSGETVGTLHDRLAPLGGNLIVKTLDTLATGEIQPQIQDESKVTEAPKISKEMCRINFNQPAEKVKWWIHGLSPFPGAFTTYQDKTLKIFTAEVLTDFTHNAQAGTIIKMENDVFHIACKTGAIAVKSLQLQGKKRMGIVDFLRGRQLELGTVLV